MLHRNRKVQLMIVVLVLMTVIANRAIASSSDVYSIQNLVPETLFLNDCVEENVNGEGGFSTDRRPLEKVLVVPVSNYHISIQEALVSMGLSEGHLEMWIHGHSDSALRHLRFMPTNLQLRVANLATFIKKENKRLDHKTAWRESAALVHYSHKYGVPVPLATGVALVESRFNPVAESRKGALGVMQVRWSVHHGLLRANGIVDRQQMFDPEKGIAAGCLLLSRYIKAYGNIQGAMDRYYGGSSFSYMKKVNRNIAKLLNHENAGGKRIDL